MQQCTTPQFVAALVRNAVPCTSLWREKTREFGVEATARLIADCGIALSGYCFAGLITSPDRDEAAKARDDVRRALDEAAAVGAPCLVFVAGGVDARDRNIADARERALEGIADLLPHARGVGVKLALEPLHPMICATRLGPVHGEARQRLVRPARRRGHRRHRRRHLCGLVGPGDRARDRARRQAHLLVPRQRLAPGHPRPASRPRHARRRRHRPARAAEIGRGGRVRRLHRVRDILAARLVATRSRRSDRGHQGSLRQGD